MAQDLYDYAKMVERALRGVVRDALARAAREGLRGGHHFFISFRTAAPGVEIPDHLAAKYPDEVTIVLQHQYWDLKVGEEAFSVGLSFQNRPERLRVPFAAITGFNDPSVRFGLTFDTPPVAADPPAKTKERAAPPAALDALPAPKSSPRSQGGAAKSEDAPEPSQSAPAAKEKSGAEVVALDKFRKK